MPRLIAAVMAGLVFSAVNAVPASAGDKPSGEAATAARLAALGHDRPALRAFFRAMPKGGDLHNHLDGAVDAEAYVAWAAAGRLCADPVSNTLVAPPCTPPVNARDAAVRRRLVDAWTMHDFVPGRGESGHDHFFATFEKFGLAFDRNQPASLIVAARHAGADRLDYVEFMVSVLDELPAFSRALAGVSDHDDDAHILAAVQPELAAETRAARARYAAMDAARAALCAVHRRDPACRPTVRYIIEVIRAFPYKQVVAQTALAFALARSDPRVVGVNMVAPEDAPASLAQYAREMRLIARLRDPLRPVHVSLHAGELTAALVPRADLRDHIRAAVTIAGAERIGHGVDIAGEDDAPALLRRMARDHVLVEIGLTSNDVILGVRGAAHPLPRYLRAGVPVALITDDEGVSRIDLTNEFVRATADYALDYATIKTLVRNSLEYAFAPGASLWIGHSYTAARPACASFAEPAPAPCARLLRASLKMRLQYRLERELRAFEAGR